MDEATVIFAKDEGVDRSSVAWERKFCMLKFAYRKHIAFRSNSGAAGDSPLHSKPAFFEEMYELEKFNARQNLPRRTGLCVHERVGRSGEEGADKHEEE